MNFFAHATVALWRSSEPRFLLGAMLPDLTSMVGVRLRGASDPLLAAGIAFHHETDAAFHGARIFVALCSEGLQVMGAAGVGRGTARAVAHVGTELLLDGALSQCSDARGAYGQALERAAAERWVDALELDDDSNRERLHEGLVWLASAALPENYREPDFVVARLRSILSRRPRLAMQPQDLPSVQAFIRDCSERVASDWPELLEQVRSALRSSDAPV
jgi:acyl carrier protein phosphodiesterase